MTACFLCGSVESLSMCEKCGLCWFCGDHEAMHRTGENKSCFPFKIERRRNVGRVVVASRDIQPGELILTDKAISHGPKERGNSSNAICIRCLNTNTGQICPACTLPVCPDSHCQTAHAEECQWFHRFADEETSVKLASVAPLRLMSKMKSDKILQARLDLLMDHNDERLKENAADQEHRELSLKMAAKGDDSTLMSRSVGLLRINALESDGGKGRILFPTFSFLSHSCTNNARHVIQATGNSFNIKYDTCLYFY